MSCKGEGRARTWKRFVRYESGQCQNHLVDRIRFTYSQRGRRTNSLSSISLCGTLIGSSVLSFSKPSWFQRRTSRSIDLGPFSISFTLPSFSSMLFSLVKSASGFLSVDMTCIRRKVRTLLGCRLSKRVILTYLADSVEEICLIFHIHGFRFPKSTRSQDFNSHILHF
jgi:hypothetical protein